MPEESGEITAEQLLAAAEQHDAVTDVGETPVVEIEELRNLNRKRFRKS